MKNKVIGIVSLFAFVFICTSGLFEGIMNFFIWLVTLNATQSAISKVGEIFVKSATFAISFTTVGIISKALNWFNGDLMSVGYFIVSTLVSFGLCYIVMLLETYLLYVAIFVAVALLVVIVIAVIMYSKNRKEEKRQSTSLKTE